MSEFVAVAVSLIGALLLYNRGVPFPFRWPGVVVLPVSVTPREYRAVGRLPWPLAIDAETGQATLRRGFKLPGAALCIGALIWLAGAPWWLAALVAGASLAAIATGHTAILALGFHRILPETPKGWKDVLSGFLVALPPAAALWWLGLHQGAILVLATGGWKIMAYLIAGSAFWHIGPGIRAKRADPLANALYAFGTFAALAWAVS